MDRLQSMKVFAKVVETGSFAAAAESLGLASSVVTRYVADLERHLGTRLLNRTTRRQSLTEMGAAYVERCQQILADVEEADQAAGQATRVLRGPLRINAPVSFGFRHLAPVASAFMARNPDVMLDISLIDRVVDLVDEGFDLAIRIARIPSSSLIARKLAPARMVLCASPGYLKQHGVPKTPEELTKHRCLQYSYWSTRDEWRFVGPGKREVGVRIKSAMYSNSGEMLRVAALDGAGIILQPSFLVGPDLLQRALVPLLPDYEVPELGIYAVYPSRRYVSAKLRAFVDYVAQNFTEQPAWDAWMH